MKEKLHRIYYVYNEFGELVYIGSSELTIEKIEDNHRNYQQNFKESGYRTKFREHLSLYGENWTFKVYAEYICTRGDIEFLEGKLIRRYRPRYNKDLNPFKTSKRYDRIPLNYIPRDLEDEDKTTETLLTF